MNHHEEVPGFLGEFLRPDGSKRPEVERGEVLPADVLKKVEVLLKQLLQADKEHQGSHYQFVYVAPGAQHVERQYIKTHPQPLPIWRGVDSSAAASHLVREKGGEVLPEVLRSDKAMVLWRKAQAAGWVDDNYQPLLSRTQAALLADAMAERLGIKEKWKVFETLWNRKYMRSDYNLALTRKGSLDFQDELKQLFG